MSSHHRKRSPRRVRSPLPDIPRAPVTPSFTRRNSLTSTLSARSKAYRDTLRMPAMVPAPEDDDDTTSRIFDGRDVSATMSTVNIKETYRERYMETDAAKANAEIGLPEVRIKPKKQFLPQPSSPKSSIGSIFGSVFSKQSSKGYSLEELYQVEHAISPKLISSPKLLQQKHAVGMTDLENDESDEIKVLPTSGPAKTKSGRRKRSIMFALLTFFLISAVAGVTIVLMQNTNLNGNGQTINNGGGVPTPTSSPIVSVSTASPLTSLPTKSPTTESTLAPTKNPTKKPSLAPTPAPTIGSISIGAATNLCAETDPNTFICINSEKFFTCGSNGRPVTQGFFSQSVVLNSCSGGSSCACTPLTQSISSSLSICTATNSGSCQDLS